MREHIEFKPLLISTLSVFLAMPLTASGQDTPSAAHQARQLRQQPAIELETTRRLDSRRLSRDFSSLLDKSEFTKADATYQASVAATANPAQKATVDLSYANSLARIARRDKNPALLRNAEKHFASAIEKGTNLERVAAINNYAKTSLELGDSARAVELFEEGQAQAEALGDSTAMARYQYNYGNALASQRRLDDAFSAYMAAYRANPREKGAAAAALKVATEQSNAAAAAELVNALIAQGQLDAANEALRSLLADTDMRARRDFVPVIEALYDFLVARRVDDNAYESGWIEYLQSVTQGMHEWPRNYMELCRIAYDDLPVIANPRRARAKFASWAGHPGDAQHAAEVLRSPSRYLAGVGEIYAREGRLEQALARYLLAWGLDNSNLEAGQFAANLLYEYRDQLDPDQQLLNEFVSRLFRGKGQAYLGEDWPAIFRFHSVLAGIYVRDEVWGSSYEARSAIFQLEHALRARKRIENTEDGRAPVPGLYAMLGQAYDGVGDNKKAFDNYLKAAEDAMRLNDNEQARENVENANRLAHRPTPAQLQLLQRIQQSAG